MSLDKIKNIISFSLKLRYLNELGLKAYRRLFTGDCEGEVEASKKWCESKVESYDTFCRELNEELWEEALEYGAYLERYSTERLGSLKEQLGGGGNYPLLYFLVRYLQPDVVVETGVAAGYSSCAILKALDNNGLGKLYSSDFPYFRLKNPEAYIGYLVEESLKYNWELFIEGDKKNLRAIVGKISKVDFIHYDSDKTRIGRRDALSALEPVMTDDAVIVMDDIQDNLFFKDYVDEAGKKYHVFCFGGKYLGIIYPNDRLFM